MVAAIAPWTVLGHSASSGGNRVAASISLSSATPPNVLGVEKDELSYTQSGITWRYVDWGDGWIGITGASPQVSSLTIPAVINGFNVGAIEEGAFEGWTQLKSVSLPAGMFYIGSRAFYGTGLTSLVIPAADLEEYGEPTCLGEYAFANCRSLKSVTLEIGYKEILAEDQTVFEGCPSTLKFTYYGSCYADLYANGGYFPLGGFTDAWYAYDDDEDGDIDCLYRYPSYGSSIGALPVPVRPGYFFLGWFTDPAGGAKITSSAKMNEYENCYYAHWLYDGSAFVGIAVEGEGGTVSGGNVNAKAGTKLTLKATPDKGSAFVGWYEDGELLSTSPTFQYVATGESDVMLMALFVAAADDFLAIDIEEIVTLPVYDSVDDSHAAYFEIATGSAATVSVSGLPSGVKFDAKTNSFSGAPTKKGVYYVTYSAKNGNGFTRSAIQEWRIGDDPTNGDYDNIGLDYWFDPEALENLYTGDTIDLCLNLKSISGLPTGLKFQAGSRCGSGGSCTSCSGFVYGTVSKAGKYKLTFSDYGGSKAVKTIVVQDAGCRYLNVQSPNLSRGTVTGSKVYAVGAKASISAKPAKNYYFGGWYCDEGFEKPLRSTASGDWRKASDSVVVTEDVAASGIYAKFVSRDEDDISIDCDDTWNVDTLWSDYFYVGVGSETQPTVTVKGLPSGVVWNKSTFEFESTPSKLKPGTAVATITAKNLSGKTVSKTVRIAVPNIESWVFDGLDYSGDAYNLTLGVGDQCVDAWVSFRYDSSYTVTASGLPSGLKLVVHGGYAEIVGTPTKAGTYTVTLTAKSGNHTEKATFTININPMPDYAVGTFNGLLRDEDSDDVVGSFVFTAAANGKLSIKVVTQIGTMNLSASSWNCFSEEDGPTAYFTKTSKAEDFWIMLAPIDGSAWNCDSQLSGEFSWRKTTNMGESYVYGAIGPAQRNPFSKTGSAYDHPEAAQVANVLASEYKSKNMVILWDDDLDGYRLVCADCVLLGGYDYGTATLKMNANGTVSVSGKFYGLYSFTATATLAFDTACIVSSGAEIYGEHCYATFTPVIKMLMCPLSGPNGGGCIYENELAPLFWDPLY